jgi:hypothetical protein
MVNPQPPAPTNPDMLLCGFMLWFVSGAVFAKDPLASWVIKMYCKLYIIHMHGEIEIEIGDSAPYSVSCGAPAHIIYIWAQNFAHVHRVLYCVAWGSGSAQNFAYMLPFDL